jgi:hypothetical protein
MRDGKSHTVLVGVSSSFTSGSCSSDVLIQLLKKDTNSQRYSLTPIQLFDWNRHYIVVEYSSLLGTVEGTAKTCLL